jgi:hypothetical protein
VEGIFLASFFMCVSVLLLVYCVVGESRCVYLRDINIFPLSKNTPAS